MKRKGKKRIPWWRRCLRWFMLAALVWLTATSAMVFFFRFVNPPISSFMLQRVAHARIGGEPGFELRHEWRSLAAVAPAMRLAAIAAEDQKFPDHYGFDLDALREAAQEHLAGGGWRGGSTISQQTAKNLFLWPGRSWARKGLEAYFTVLIEAFWPKRRILEVYLNIAEFGDGIYGVEAAARAHFNKPATELTENEASRLAAVLPAPTRYTVHPPSAHVVERAAWIRRQMRALGGPAYLAGIDAN